MSILRVGYDVLTCEYNTDQYGDLAIQTAIDAAQPGDTIEIYPKQGPPVMNLTYNTCLTIPRGVSLVGMVPNQGIVISANADNPCLFVSTATGAFAFAYVENITFLYSRVNPPATAIVDLSAGHGSIVESCVVVGNAGKTCTGILYGILVSNCMVSQVATGLYNTGANMVCLYIHNTVCNFSLYGIRGSTSGSSTNLRTLGNISWSGDVGAQAMAYSNPGLMSACNVLSDYSGAGRQDRLLVSQADMGFVNYAGGDYRITDASMAFFRGLRYARTDMRGFLRRRTGRFFAGAYDPDAQESYVTGASLIRSV